MYVYVHASVCLCLLYAAATEARAAGHCTKVTSRGQQVEDRLAFLELMPFWWAQEQKSRVV